MSIKNLLANSVSFLRILAFPSASYNALLQKVHKNKGMETQPEKWREDWLMSSDRIPEKKKKRTPKHRGKERGQEKIWKTRDKAACLHETGGKGEILRSRCMPLAGTLGKTSVNRACQTHLSAWLQVKVHFFGALWKLFFPVFRTTPEYWTLGAARPASGFSRRALSQRLKRKF